MNWRIVGRLAKTWMSCGLLGAVLGAGGIGAASVMSGCAMETASTGSEAQGNPGATPTSGEAAGDPGPVGEGHASSQVNFNVRAQSKEVNPGPSPWKGGPEGPGGQSGPTPGPGEQSGNGGNEALHHPRVLEHVE